MMIPELLLVILLIVGLMGVYGDSVLQCPNTTIEGKDGDTVILPCSTKNKKDISHEEVEWSFWKNPAMEGGNVHLYYQDEDQLQTQSDDFKDRTSLFKEELSSGNCSLSLIVNTSHNGSYQCRVVIDGTRHDCLVNLKVLPKRKDPSQKHQEVTESPDKPDNGTDGLTTTLSVVLCVAALLLIALVIYWIRKQRCSQRNSNNPQNDQGVLVQALQPPQNQENNPADPNQNEDRSQMIENEDQDDPADGNEPTADN